MAGARTKRVLIAGCGYVGSALAVRLAAAGHVVFALRRSASELPRNVTPFEADLLVPKTLRHVPDVDLVCFLAADVRARSEVRRATRVTGVASLVAALAARRVRLERLVVGSCVSVYGGTDARWVDEDSAAVPSDAAGEDARAAELAARDADPNAVIVRIGDVYGPGRLGVLERVLDGASLGPSDARFTNPIHRDDVAGILEHLLFAKKTSSHYVAVDREPVEVPALAEWLAGNLGKRPPAIDASGVAGSLPATNVRCMSDRVVEAGYKFRYPTYRDGYRAVLSQLRR